jgi:hypothetical protein
MYAVHLASSKCTTYTSQDPAPPGGGGEKERNR